MKVKKSWSLVAAIALLDWTVELEKIASEVTLIHRRDAFRGAPDTEMKVRDLAAKKKINLLTPYIIKDVALDSQVSLVK